MVVGPAGKMGRPRASLQRSAMLLFFFLYACVTSHSTTYALLLLLIVGLLHFFFHKLATPTRLLHIPNGSFPASPQTQENLNEAKEMRGGIATTKKAEQVVVAHRASSKGKERNKSCTRGPSGWIQDVRETHVCVSWLWSASVTL